MSGLEVVGTIIAGAALLVPVIWWGINQWSNAAKELEQIKAHNTKRAIDSLDSEVKEFRASIQSVQASINQLSQSILSHRQEIATLKRRLDETRELIELYQKNHSEFVRGMIRTELLELSKNLAMLKNKKN